jgi:HAD superfamily hydrolase (TIGR01490 family)
MSKIAAFLDMDNTLIAGNSGFLYLKFLRREGRVGLTDFAQSVWWLLQYRLNMIDMDTVSRRAVAKMAGDPEDELITRNQEWFEAMVQPLVYPEAFEIVRRHKEEGHVTVIVTASTFYAAAPLARYLGVEHIICTQLEVKDGCFTGRYHEPFCYGKGKIHWTRRFCEEQDVHLERSFFYTDSFSDLPMLESVGTQIVVNPDFKLRTHARTRGWPILRFRRP